MRDERGRKPMKIEVWSDYVCPFCYIGKRRLEEALQKTGLSESTEVVFKAFQLDPTTPEDAKEHVAIGLAKKYGMSQQEAEGMLQNVKAQAQTVGLDYNVDAMKEANTLKAHQLAKYAEQQGKAASTSERLLHGYFEKGEAIGDPDVLMTIAKELELDLEEVERVFKEQMYVEEVHADIAEAGKIGVRGVPFFVLNRKYAISGAQPVEAFEEALRKVAEEEGITPQLTVLSNADQGVCKDGQCEL